MKLIFKSNPEFSRLEKYFKRIEALADQMGMNVDELVDNDQKKKIEIPLLGSESYSRNEIRSQTFQKNHSRSLGISANSNLKIL